MLADVIRLMLFPALMVFPALMAFAASSDLLTMTISNRVSIALIAGFFMLAPVIGMNPSLMLTHIGAGALVLVVAFVFFAQGWIGGGDAKLAAATALWLGFDHMLDYLVCASLLGGMMTILLLQVRKWPLPGLLLGQEWVERLHRKDSGVPYGIALAASALLVYPDTIWMRAIAG
jgi:prepilin peptidase CpaA